MNKIKLLRFLLLNDISYAFYNKVLNDFYEYKVMYINNLLSEKATKVVKFILKINY